LCVLQFLGDYRGDDPDIPFIQLENVGGADGAAAIHTRTSSLELLDSLRISLDLRELHRAHSTFPGEVMHQQNTSLHRRLGARIRGRLINSQKRCRFQHEVLMRHKARILPRPAQQVERQERDLQLIDISNMPQQLAGVRGRHRGERVGLRCGVRHTIRHVV